MADRMDMMFEILMGIRSDLGLIRREQVSQGLRLSSIERLLGIDDAER